MRRRPPPTAATEQVAESEEIAKDIAEIGKRVGVEARLRGALQTLVPETVVGGPFLRIAQDAVGLGGLLELLLRIRVIGVAVGMVRQGEFSVGRLDLLVVSLPGNPEDIVIVFFCHGLTTTNQGLTATFTKDGRNSFPLKL